MQVIDVQGLKKSFGSLQVLNGIDLAVEEGEILSIIGGSGCGKSVFLRCLNLLEKPDGGKIFIDGEEITAADINIDNIRRRMGMVMQKFNLFAHLDVMDNLCLAPTHLLGMTREKAEEKARALLRDVGLAAKAHVFPALLSGGQQQRIAICRALMMEPKALLLDEPTSALDPTMVGEVLAVIRMLAKRKLTMLIVTHEMNFAREVSDRILFFADGVIYEQGTPQEIFESPRKEKTIAFIQRHRYFHWDIRSKLGFDLMEMQGGVWLFTEKYGIGDKRAYSLQLCLEEIIYEFFQGSYPAEDLVNIKIDVTYAGGVDTINIDIISGGLPYDPLTAIDIDPEALAHIGVAIVKKKAKSFRYDYEQDKNRLRLEL